MSYSHLSILWAASFFIFGLPYITNDLAGSNEHASKRQELSSELDAWMKKQGDPGEILDAWEAYQSAKKGIHFKREFD